MFFILFLLLLTACLTLIIIIISLSGNTVAPIPASQVPSPQHSSTCFTPVLFCVGGLCFAFPLERGGVILTKHFRAIGFSTLHIVSSCLFGQRKAICTICYDCYVCVMSVFLCRPGNFIAWDGTAALTIADFRLRFHCSHSFFGFSGWGGIEILVTWGLLKHEGNQEISTNDINTDYYTINWSLLCTSQAGVF